MIQGTVHDLDHLVPSIVAGDPDAFARWVAGAEPRVRASLLRFAEEVDVEAVLQECLLRVWQVAPRFVSDSRPEGLLRLAVRIGRNLALDDMRRRRVRPEVLDAMERDFGETFEPSPPDPRLRATIAVCRDALPEKPALVLRARLQSGDRADRDLALALGMKLNTFLKNFGRARALLAECLKRHGIDVAQELA